MIHIAIEAAKEAGKILRHYLGKVKQVETKENQQFNLVTEADRASERKIIEVIHRYYPKHGILGEEGGERLSESPYKWIIDPLDGTTNFTHGFPIFSVSIALEKDGEILLGVVYDPVSDEMFHAEKGGGAFLNQKPIHVSSVADIESSILVTGFPYNVRENPDHCSERFIGFLMHAQAIRRLGSAALDCAYVACGRLDGFWEVALQPWDKAAGVLLILEAGGTVTNFEGGSHSIYELPFLGSNGRIHSQMVDILIKAKSLKIVVEEPLIGS